MVNLGSKVDPPASDRVWLHMRGTKDGPDDELDGSIDSNSRLVEIDNEDVDGPFCQTNSNVPTPPPDSPSHWRSRGETKSGPWTRCLGYVGRREGDWACSLP